MGPYHEDTDHPWHRLERGEVTLAEARAANLARSRPPAWVGRQPLAEMAFETNDEMVELVRDLRGGGLRTGLLTEQRPRAARPLVGAAPLRRAVRRRGRQPRGRDAQAQPRPSTGSPWSAGRDRGPHRVPGRHRQQRRAALAEGMVGVLVEGDGAEAIAHVRELAGLS
jgi:hypothetical protein